MLCEPIIYILLCLLTPILPAYILYAKYPKDKTFVQGPFKGFKIGLSGAGALYFIGLLTAVGLVSKLYPTDMCRENKYWTVEGVIQSGCTLAPDEILIYPDEILIYPPDKQIYKDGSFYIKNIPIIDIESKIIPRLVIEKKGYQTFVLKLLEGNSNGYSIECDKDARHIKILNPIVLLQAITIESSSQTNSISTIPLGKVKK